LSGKPTPSRMRLEAAAMAAIKKLSEGVSIDDACRAVHPGFGAVQFRRALRKNDDLREAYRLARIDYVAHEVDSLLRLADSGPGMTRDELAALKIRIDTRKWLAEKLLDEFQPKLKTEHSGAVPLIVETNVPRKLSVDSEEIKDAEVRPSDPPNLHDVL
jgi:hypothetical protein